MVTPVLALCLDFSGGGGSLFARSCLGRTCPSRAWCDVSRVPILRGGGERRRFGVHERQWIHKGCIFGIHVDLRILQMRGEIQKKNSVCIEWHILPKKIDDGNSMRSPLIQGLERRDPRVLNRMDRPAPVGPPGKLLLSAVKSGECGGLGSGGQGAGKKGRRDKAGQEGRANSGQSSFSRPRKRLRGARAAPTCRPDVTAGYDRRRGSSD